ncbi:hypothetical protein [Streptomyces prasinus]
MDFTPTVAVATDQEQTGPQFAPAISAASVVAVTNGREMASDRDKELFYF